jgi:hypothetical protein
MMARLAYALALAAVPANSVVIDRIAVIVGNHVIKDSDIVRDIRVVGFLNRQRPSFSPASRKQCASRLIDQEFIREEMSLGVYPKATPAEAAELLDRLRASRSASPADWTDQLLQAHLTDSELRDALAWQMTVLRFISLKFRPGVFIPEEELRQYYGAHRAELEAANPDRPPTFDGLRPAIQTTLVEDRVNQLFSDWLDEKRKEARIIYREAELK